MRTRRVLIAAAVVILLGAAAAAGVWWWIWYEPERPLEPRWTAVVSTIAGGGALGSPAESPYSARFADPFGIASAADGTIYVADGAGAHRIYRLAPDGTLTTLAGSDEGRADGQGMAARFSTPSGVALDATGNLYVADTGNDAIRRITPEGVVTTVAGAVDGLKGPIGVAVDAGGRVIVADTYNDRIVALAPGGGLTVVAGGDGPGFEDGIRARFDTPGGIDTDAAGNIYVADTGNAAIRVISPDGAVSTMSPGYTDGYIRPLDVAVATGGSVFVADALGRVLEILPDGALRTVAGGEQGFADGAGSEARFRYVAGIALQAPGRLLVTDRRNGVVRLVVARSQAERRAPAPPIAPAFDAAEFGRTPLFWPFWPIEGPFEVTGTLGEPRGGEGSERFHAGLDVHAPEGTAVRAVRDGAVADPLAVSGFGSINESVRVGPVTYVHLRVGRDARDRPIGDRRFVVTRDEAGDVTRIRIRRGSRFTTGEVIGSVNRFYHAHLNVGWPGEELNPLRFGLVGFEDSIPPVIVRGGVRVIGEDGQPLTTRQRRRLVVHGRVRILVDAWDHVNGNQARRRLGLYRLGYQLRDAAGTPVGIIGDTRETLRFDRHPEDDAARIVYASGSGIPVYGSRRTRFLYVVTSTLRDGVATDGVLDTTWLPPGDYTLRILAADIAGNEALANRDVAITITPPGE